MTSKNFPKGKWGKVNCIFLFSRWHEVIEANVKKSEQKLNVKKNGKGSAARVDQ